MELRHIKYFVAVAENLSFTAAAYALNVAQPSVSQQISELESELGVKLFSRSSRFVELTPAGSVFLQSSKEILEACEKAIEKTIRTFKGETGELRIAVLEPAVSHFLPEVIRQYRMTYPNVRIKIEQMNPDVQLKAFSEEKIDIGFSRPSPEGNLKDIKQKLVYMDDIVAVLPLDHPFSTKEKIALKDLSQENFILFDRLEAQGYFNLIVNFCKDEGKFFPNVTQEASLLQTLFLMVELGLGVSLCPGCIRTLNYKKVALVEIEEKSPDVPLIISHKLSPTRIVQNFLEVYESTIKKFRFDQKLTKLNHEDGPVISG